VLAQSGHAPVDLETAYQLTMPEEVQKSLSPADLEQAAQAVQAGRRVLLVEFQPSPQRAAEGLNITSVRSRLASLGELIKVVPRSVATAPTGIAFCLLIATDAPDEAVAEAAGGPATPIQEIAISERVPPPEAALAPELELPNWGPSDQSIRVDVRKLDE